MDSHPDPPSWIHSPEFVVRLFRCCFWASVPEELEDVAVDGLWNCFRRPFVDSWGNGDACRSCSGDCRLAVPTNGVLAAWTAANAAKGFVLSIPKEDGWYDSWGFWGSGGGWLVSWPLSEGGGPPVRLAIR